MLRVHVTSGSENSSKTTALMIHYFILLELQVDWFIYFCKEKKCQNAHVPAPQKLMFSGFLTIFGFWTVGVGRTKQVPRRCPLWLWEIVFSWPKRSIH